MIPVTDDHFQKQLESVKNLLMSEINVKNIDFLSDTSDILIKKIKPNFKSLGPRYGKLMKQIATALAQFDQKDIVMIEKEGRYLLDIDGSEVELHAEDVKIITEDIPGWAVSNLGNLTVALDITVTPQLKEEGLARELVNRIQNLRKDQNFEVTDRILLKVEKNNEIDAAINNNYSYICSETLAESLDLCNKIESDNKQLVKLTDDIQTFVSVEKIG